MDSSTLASATVSISGNFRPGEDLLSFTNDGGTMGNIRSSYAADTGILTLISPGATATLSEWSHALRAVSYSNASEAPAGGTRTLSLVVNDGITSSSPASTAIEIAAVNDAPVLSIARPGDGKVTTAFSAQNDTGYGVAVQSDGRIILSGTSGHDFALARFNVDGAPDSGFGNDGVVLTNPGSLKGIGRDVVLQPDGKILMVGSAGTQFDPSEIVLARYNADGTLDTTFDGDGTVSTAIGIMGTEGNAVTLQPDGKIIVVGRAHVEQFFIDIANFDFAVARYNPDGSLDTTFGAGGKLTTPLSVIPDWAEGLTVQPDGKIVVCGTVQTGSFSQFAIARYNPNGTPDMTFDADGKVTIALGSGAGVAHTVVAQPDGKLLVGGDLSDVGFGLARLNPDGSLDATFAGGGTIADFNPFGGGYGVTLQPDGKILFAGSSRSLDNPRFSVFALARYNSDGSLDATFGTGGKVTTAIGDTSTGRGIALQPDGKIVVAGNSTIDGNSEFAVVRYNADGTLDTSFNPVPDRPVSHRHGAAVVIDPHAHVFDAELAAQGDYAGASLKIQRAGGPSADDLFVASGPLGTLAAGASLLYAGIDVGSVAGNSGGVLTLIFNGNATQERIDGVLKGIAYANASAAPGLSIRLEWLFSDGNDTAVQGSGGALSATGMASILIGDSGLGLDTNADGKSDILWRGPQGQTSVWLMDGPNIAQGGFLLAPPPSWTLVDGYGDYNGDGKTDVLWRGPNGETTVWQLDGTQLTQSVSAPSLVSLDWHVVDGHGDYNGDGKSDILWRGPQGQTTMWMMNGGLLVQDVAVPGPIPVGWNILNGHADYNGDGKSDILWRGPEGQVSVWLMNGPTIVQGNALGTIPLDWSIVDSQGDYNGDGKSDLLWRGPLGQTSMWLMDGSNIALGQFLPGPIPPDWTIADGHGDYNGDGKSDLLWRGPQGQTSVWLMDGSNIAQGGVLLAPPLFWKIVDGHGDYNGDGKSDVLWRGPDGQTVLWQINGTQLTQSSGLPGPIPADWSVTGESGPILVGNAGADTLSGTDAADTLRDNGVGDRFVFDAPLNASTNVDTVLDFRPGEDKLSLSEVIFTHLPVGALSAGSFVSGANPVAQDANDFVLYNTSNGQVSYDADGNGPGAAIAFATLFGNPTLTANDISVITG